MAQHCAHDAYLHLVDRAPDWALICADGEKLPCHGDFLAALSPVLAGLRETRPREDGSIAVPFKHPAALGAKLLHWVYRHHLAGPLSVTDAKALAALSHEWHLPGLAQPCDAVLERLVREAQGAEGGGVLESLVLAGEDFFDLAALAAQCDLKETLSRCEHIVATNLLQLGPDLRLSHALPAASWQRIALGAFSSAMAGKTGLTCSDCGGTDFSRGYRDDFVCSGCEAVRHNAASPDNGWLRHPLQPASLDHLRGWACQAEAPTPGQLLQMPRRKPQG